MSPEGDSWQKRTAGPRASRVQMRSAACFGVGGSSPLRDGAFPVAPGAWVFGVGCLRALEPESGSEGQLAGKRGWSAGRGRERAKKREPKGYVVN